MARVARVTPVDGEGHRGDPVEINLDHVLWMEEHPQGTLLLMNQWSSGNHPPRALINSSMIVAESEREILWAVTA